MADDGGPDEVATVFQNPDDESEDENLGTKTRKVPSPPKRACSMKSARMPGGARRAVIAPASPITSLDQVHHRGGPAEDRLEEKRHRGQKNQPSEKRREQDIIYPILASENQVRLRPKSTIQIPRGFLEVLVMIRSELHRCPSLESTARPGA